MSESKEKIHWNMALPVTPEVKFEVVRICRQQKVRIPVLVGALIEAVFSTPGFVESVLRDSRLPKSHQRFAEPQPPLESTLDLSDDVQGVRVLENTPEADSRVDRMRKIIAEVEASKSGLATVHPIRTQSVELPSNVVPIIPPKEVRRTSLQELCEMVKLPGEYLDEELNAIQARWEEKWGEPTDEEFERMGEAAQVRSEVYRQWRERYRVLQAEVQKAQTEVEGLEGRALRKAKLRLETAQGDLEVFKLRVRWDERKMSELHPWEVPAP